jgi:hypothetical protein
MSSCATAGGDTRPPTARRDAVALPSLSAAPSQQMMRSAVCNAFSGAACVGNAPFAKMTVLPANTFFFAFYHQMKLIKTKHLRLHSFHSMTTSYKKTG